MKLRQHLKEKKRIVIKVGSSTVMYDNTGNINLEKLEKFVRILINLRNQGKDVIVVSSGAVGIGRTILGIKEKPSESATVHACAAVGQGKLMMIYEKLFSEYGQHTAQVLLTKESIMNENCQKSAQETFEELLQMEVVPIVNENDAIAVDQNGYGVFGDNDTLSAHVASLVGADLLILLSDIEGLYTDDPRKNPNARFVHTVAKLDDEFMDMGKGATTDVGTGGMATKLKAAQIAIDADVDMIIADGNNIYVINDIVNGKKVGTLFLAKSHSYQGENELAPERQQFRRQAKRNRKLENRK